MTIEQDVHRLGGNQLVDLYEIDATALGGTVSRICNESNALGSDVVWQGNTYTRFPVDVSGFEYSGKGQLPRPRIRVANVTGLMGALVRDYNDLVGAKFTRRRTMVKYLDAVNFPARRNLLEWTEDLRTTDQAFVGRPWANFTTADTTATYEPAVLNSVGVAGVVKLQAATAVNAQRQVSQGASFADNTIVCSSVEVKAAEISQVRVYVGTKAATYPSVQFNLLTGAVVLTGGTLAAYGITPLGNGWFRCWAAADVLTGASSPAIVVQIPQAAYAVGSGFYVSRAQLEAGSAPSEYQAVNDVYVQNPDADPTASLPDEIYYVDRKSTENKVLIEFELAPSFDVTGVQLPRRVIAQNVCLWKYRSAECGYAGTSYFNANDTAVGTLALDVCGKRLASCKKRFGTFAELPFGSFPAAGLTR